MAPNPAESALLVCKVCGESKALAEMSLIGGKPTNRCKGCKNAYSKRWREQNVDRTAEYTRRRSSDPEHLGRKRAYMRQRYHGMPQSERRDRELRRNYGISLAEYDEMARQQNGACAICGDAPTDDGVLSVDHCHDTSVVRGLLCPTCNLAIGYMKDSPDNLLAAAAYLLRHTNVLEGVK